MSGLLASLSVSRALEKLSSFLRALTAPSTASSSSSSREDDLEELRRLERTMRRIRATLHDAEEHWNIREASAKLRLKELKEVAYDIEDMVDEYEYEVDRHRVEVLDLSTGVRNTGKRKYEDKEACAVDMGVVAVPYELVLEARKITERFNEIIHYSDHFTLSENDGERRFTPDIRSLRHSSSVVFEKNILGREQDRDIIVEKLFSRERQNVRSPISVMAIVGMGGLGKTTLAQLVYNSPRVSQSFDKRAWVCVSEYFDVIRITRTVITALTGKHCEYTELADLQRILAAETKEMRVLLVLDDVWNERRDCWELFCMPMSAAKICQIIVTTRSRVVAKLIQTVPFYHLNCLSSDESWSLFNEAAFINEEESNISSNLINIGKSIVQKCKGLPLAIKTLGSMLRYETDESRWKDVLESELWDLKEPRDEVLPALELSYKHMPVYLRQYFLALSLFPKDYVFQAAEVLRLWKFLDFPYSDGSVDERGRLHLKELVQRSILQLGSDDDSYLLHDLIHGLACFFAGEEFYRIDGNTLTEIPQNVRYLSINEVITSADISDFPHSVRAIIVRGGFLGATNETILPESLFSNCRKLRALDLGYSKSFSMALCDGVGHLKLLRHLFLEIDLYYDSFISTQHVKNLVLAGIRHLNGQHILPGICISERRCSLNIRELRNINKIRELSIYGLGIVRHAEDAIQAQLQNKMHLRSLKLRFREDHDECLRYIKTDECPCGLQHEDGTLPHDQLLDSLRPHRNLRELGIYDYDSGKYPSWLGHASFYMLTRIVLCRGVSKHLPKLGGLPSLKYLTVEEMYYMERVHLESHSQLTGDREFRSLRELQFECMPKWFEWSGADATGFPCLNTLRLSLCPELRSLPVGPFLSLVTFNLKSCCGFATIPAFPALRKLEIEDCSALRVIPALPSLLDLRLQGCPRLISIGAVSAEPLPTGLLVHRCPSPVVSAVSTLPKLRTLELKNCPILCALGNVPSLKTLSLKSGLNDELMCSPFNDFRSLQCLNIDDMGFACISFTQQSVPLLTRLCTTNCSNLQNLDGISRSTLFPGASGGSTLSKPPHI